MKLVKNLSTFMFVAVLCLIALPASAKAATYEVEAGETVEVEIPVTDGVSGQGTLVFSDTTNFTCSVGVTEGIGSITYNSDNNEFSYATAERFTDQSIVITVEVSSSAQAGDSCTISVEDYLYCDDTVDFTMESDTLSSQTVVVVAEPTPTPTEEPTATPEPTDEPTATPEPTDEPTATPEPTDEPTATPEPTVEVTEAPDDTTVTPTPGEEQETPATGNDGIALWIVLVLVSATCVLYTVKKTNN